jgi:PDZ domain-containing secreted protein/Zn-dependent protease/predicted transcriptional regulator
MNSSFTLFRVRGIAIGANWSWLIVAAFFVFSLTSYFAATYPGLTGSTYVAMGFVTVVLFFGSLVLHELGHAFRALKEGMEIEGITLWLFGGVAKFKGMFPSAGAEFRIAIAGPIVTAVISGGLFVLTALLNAVKAPVEIVGIPFYLAQINLLLLGFNLVPALPLDGGRVYRAYLWQRKQDFSAATAQAARTARGIATAMIVLGALMFLRTSGSGLWFVFLGWFLLQAARGEATYARFRQALGGLTVGDLMTRDVEIVDPDLSLASFFDDVVHLRGHSAYPVVEDGRFLGLLSLRRAAEIPAEQRFDRVARDAMAPRAEVPTMTPDTDVNELVPHLQADGGRVVVLDDERVVGIVSSSDVAKAIQFAQLHGPIAGPHPVEPKPSRGPAYLFIAVLVVGLLALAGRIIALPIVVIGPGASFDVSKDIKITGIDATKVHGGFYLTSVSVYQPNVYGFVGAVFSGKQIANLSAVIPKGVDQDTFFTDQRAEFDESREIAAAAAAKAAGLDVAIKGTGAKIVRIVPDSPASKILKEGDVVTAVNAAPVRLAQDLSRVIRARPAGTTFDLKLERGGKTVNVKVASRAGIAEGTTPAVGVLLETRDFDVDLPFKVDFKKRDIGGPSAGSTYALAIYDMLSPKDVAGGRKIAGTGTISIEGQIGPIGGIEEKAIAAKDAGATLFVVPKSEARDVAGSDLKIVGVTTLDEAVKALGA